MIQILNSYYVSLGTLIIGLFYTEFIRIIMHSNGYTAITVHNYTLYN